MTKQADCPRCQESTNADHLCHIHRMLSEARARIDEAPDHKRAAT